MKLKELQNNEIFEFFFVSGFRFYQLVHLDLFEV